MLPASSVFSSDMTFNDCRSTDFNSWRMPEISDGQKTYSKTVSYSDYDHYNHVNNTKYGDILLDAFTVDELKDAEIRMVQIKYVRQCKFGEVLDIVRSRCEDGAWAIEGRVGNELRIQMKVKLGD